MSDIFDIALIGGGINGCGIARDATGRGLKVFLCEQNDLAGGTSSASTKLIHGGLRYLEHYEFRLVREALIEREVLLGMAPHIIWPMRFVLPHHKGLRPAWLIRLGLFLYDNLGGRKILPGTRTLDLRRDPVGAAIRDDFTKAFEYSDCWVEDSRLVVLNAIDAAERGAVIRTRSRCVDARRQDGLWQVTVEGPDGARETIRARAIVNAAGPWVSRFLTEGVHQNAAARIRMVKGSHIVVPKLVDHDRAYIFQNSDNRIIFAIPYERDFTLIGTTDQDFQDDPASVVISEGEIDYLCDAASTYFKQSVTRDSIVWTYAGVRPLYDDGASKAQEATRDYVLKLDTTEGQPPILNIFGGKITTYRKLAESALALLKPHLPGMGQPWTEGATLPGGDFPVDGVEALTDALIRDYPYLPRQQALRLVRAYGTRAWQVMNSTSNASEMGVHFGADLYENEVAYLMQHEWARRADDVLWRRSKLGLRLTADQAEELESWMHKRQG
ncbi:MAG: glycerol-3-phosphate dehydrogenase [Alphaproteobacteria bacterium]|nr:glycerol-3-phosphate dehydrogenase [Alphaproteobacteria bacterium]MBU0796103.1 glycerol-3-phosphate dehydrogenase [Alphaproteobacteria bacterium]MBU0888474.1 glycerol-3-phosphate dehydrogenase [Alphaproteobacteria bacterium]MBU1813063.1 glycerol-3-phosphate dehydrogenase [Alphaproteobacteria bacterium]MBU2089408.1 glycerol-3-phosphate dehydrogenase [Alphaproteobacteria bacterium]